MDANHKLAFAGVTLTVELWGAALQFSL